MKEVGEVVGSRFWFLEAARAAIESNLPKSQLDAVPGDTAAFAARHLSLVSPARLPEELKRIVDNEFTVKYLEYDKAGST